MATKWRNGMVRPFVSLALLMMAIACCMTFVLNRTRLPQTSVEKHRIPPRKTRLPNPASKTAGQPTRTIMSRELDDAVECLETIAEAPGIRYEFMRGSDDILYYMNSDEPDPRGWLDVLIDLRAAALKFLPTLKVAPDGNIKDVDDVRLSSTEFKRLSEFLNRTEYSGLHSASAKDVVGGSAVTTCGGRGIFLTSRDFGSPRKWGKQNIVYLVHELAHVAMGGPGNQDAHNLEFWRVLRVLTVAAIGVGVYEEKWFAWDVETNRENIGAWIGTGRWWELQKDVLMKQGFRINDSHLEPGEDYTIDGTGSDLLIPHNSAPPAKDPYDPTSHGRGRDGLAFSPCCGAGSVVG